MMRGRKKMLKHPRARTRKKRRKTKRRLSTRTARARRGIKT